MPKTKTSRLVYSTDGAHLNICKRCNEQPCECVKEVEVDPLNTRLKLSLDRHSRKGKSVTVVYDLPGNDTYFKDIVKKLKALCGTGGALKKGVIEIQGDQRDKVQAYLEKLGFKIVRSGG